jgi:general secretion pathway protein E
MNGFAWRTAPSSAEPAPAEPKLVHTRVAEPASDMPIVEHTDDLPDFSKKLYDVLAMQPSLKHRLCPIETTSKPGEKKFAVIVLAEELRTDITETLVKQLKLSGYAPDEPLYYVAARSVMVELARDNINENRKAGKKSGEKKENSALWSLFESAAGFALENEASDIHIEIDRSAAQSPIKFRVDGRMTSPREFMIDTMKLLDMVAYLYNVHSKSGSENTYNENQPQQCQIMSTIRGRKVQFRWASNQTAAGTKVVMRLLIQDTQQSIRSLEDLGYLPPQVALWKRAISRLGGGTLIAGVVGSGKSTTQQTIMSMMPPWMSKYSVEDPVEYIIPGTVQFSVSRSLSGHGDDPFLAVKRQLKRMDPDAVMIGEIRDHESAGLFRDIAESGHRAFSTVHAPSAIDMITLRLVSTELGIPRDVIATPNFLNLLVYQALVPKLCSHCCVPADTVYEPAYLDKIERLFKVGKSSIRAKNAAGCSHCQRKALPELNGSRGRIVVAEMIEPTPKMLLLFRDSKNLELKEHIRSLRTAGFDEPDTTGKSALEVAMYHVARGVIDPKEVELKFGSFDQYELEIAEQKSAT